MKNNGKINDLAMFVPVQPPFCVHPYAEKLYHKFTFIGFLWFIQGMCSMQSFTRSSSISLQL